MNGTLIDAPAFPGTSTYKIRARLLLQGIGAASAQRSSLLVHPTTIDFHFEDGVADVDQALCWENSDDTWTEAKNQRRCDLIDRKYAGGLTPVETRELARLQAQMLSYSQRVAPLPIEAAERLYKQLVAGINTAPSPKNL